MGLNFANFVISNVSAKMKASKYFWIYMSLAVDTIMKDHKDFFYGKNCMIPNTSSCNQIPAIGYVNMAYVLL